MQPQLQRVVRFVRNSWFSLWHSDIYHRSNTLPISNVWCGTINWSVAVL